MVDCGAKLSQAPKNQGKIPGYMGYVPQYKFDHGSTYGRQTALIAERIPYYDKMLENENVHITPEIGVGKISKSKMVFKDEVPRDRTPITVGENRYTKNMAPGYSGNIPKMQNKYGGTFSHLANECIDEFISEYIKREERQTEVERQGKFFPKLSSTSSSRNIRDHMNIWVDNYLQKHSQRYGPRDPNEPPTSGYGGHIPKSIAANLSFGCSYSKGVTKCLSAFRTEILGHFARLQEPVDPTKREAEAIIPKVYSDNESPISSRICKNDGMIPNYSGHVSGQAFTFGRTKGDVTRNLEVCSHHYPSYGYYLRNKDLANDSCPESSPVVRNSTLSADLI